MNIIFAEKAKQDVADIINYTMAKWGYNQGETYKDLLKEAEQAIKQNPFTPLSKSRDNFKAGLRSIFAGKHIIFYHLKNKNTIEIIRILHQAMDYQRHL